MLFVCLVFVFYIFFKKSMYWIECNFILNIKWIWIYFRLFYIVIESKMGIGNVKFDKIIWLNV